MNTNDEFEFSHIADLINKQINNDISPEELAELDGWLLDNPNGQSLYERLTDDAQRQEALRRMGRFDEETAWARFGKLTKSDSDNIVQIRSRKFIRYASAAAIVAGLSIGGYFLLHQRQPVLIAQNQPHDIAPGHNQATLTLANGKKIILTKGLSGLLAQQGQTQINVNQNNIIYDAKNKTGDQFSYNTLTTARGEQSPYPLVLADGTKVWLNAESSITFPTAFNGEERIVKITGEALFEVAHNRKQPFKVKTSQQTIEDIGTTFDVNAYANEPFTKTTLVEGKVKVNGLTLNPGQQTDGTSIKTVNTDIFTAWKEGNFHFEGDNIQTIMRQLVRWYNIDVAYEGKITSIGFYGDISRNRNISAVLKMMEKTKAVHFKVEGRRVTVID